MVNLMESGIKWYVFRKFYQNYPEEDIVAYDCFKFDYIDWTKEEYRS